MQRISLYEKHLSTQKQNIAFQKKKHLQNIYDKYLHSYETRTPQQINKTTQKILNISKQNINRLQTNNISLKRQLFDNYLFICLSGLPAFSKQFDFLNLPGKYIQFIVTGFDLNITEQQRVKLIPQCRFQLQADRLRKIIHENCTKNIVLLYHSFGTYVVSSYLYKYGEQYIKGFVELGPAPIRHYKYITQVLNFTEKYTQQDLIVKIDTVIGIQLKQLMTRVNKQLGVKWDFFPYDSMGACFTSYFKSKQMLILFDLNRRYPNILKLIVFGEQDNLFETDLLSERAEFYITQNLRKQPQLKQRFEQNYSTKISNIQQKFIISIPKAKHSLHIQKKNQSIIQKAVNEYLKYIHNI